MNKIYYDKYFSVFGIKFNFKKECAILNQLNKALTSN